MRSLFTIIKAIAIQDHKIALQEKLAKEQAEAISIQERQEKERLAAYLRSLGVNPNDI
ncbi:hypothetical protein [Pseudanabaena sp. PCC 6802]|uniref:hypothetical protein n=1 Tax=Pseudanabaena sp. PCC 6802 TaxID=118173 RepID=UPI000346B934|nr:hypothetical protein [Pseudanabaena sp. PCC 6802]